MRKVQLLDHHGQPYRRERRARSERERHDSGPRSTYDSAQTTPENQNHWAWSTDLSANAEHSADVRRTIRNRARYERRNNSYAKGLVETRAHDLVGTGPRLQLTIPDARQESVRVVERANRRWMRAATMAEKLRVLSETQITDGEGFGVMVTNPRLRHAVKLDVRTYEADQIATPNLFWEDPNKAVDGIRFDEFGNPIEYHLLKNHPGDWLGAGRDYDRLPAERVVHWFRPGRPGQARGISELSAALPLFSQLRRYTLAVLTAAEFAAMLAGIMKTTASAEDGGDVEVDVWDRFPLVRGSLVALPNEWEATQFKAEQPTGTYADFKAALLGEIGRGMHTPYSVISGDGSRENFSSMRHTAALYQRAIWIERDRMQMRVLDPLLWEWFDEAVLVGLIPDDLPPFSEWDWEWHWDGFESIDPVKDATAAQIRLANGLTTFAAEFAAQGLDYVEVFDQQAKEMQMREERGLPAATSPNVSTTSDANEPSDPSKKKELAHAA